MSIYNIQGDEVYCNEPVSPRFIEYDPIARFDLPNSIASSGFTWGEGVIGSPETPIVSARSVFLGSTHQCDIRPLIYEDGSPIIEHNKIWYSMSTTQVAGGGSIIIEYNIGTSELKMVGITRGYLIENGSRRFWGANGNLVMFNRRSGKWIYATRSSNETTPDHVLVIGESYADPRDGVNEVVYSLLDYASPSPVDEDPYIIYSEELEKWVLLYAKIRNNVFTLSIQTSDNPTSGFTAFKEQSLSPMHATGLYTSKIGGVRYILTGGDQQNGHNRYTAWTFPNAEYVCDINLDYDDGGYWGWNNLTPVPCGDYTKYIMLTFDRMQTNPLSRFSYGNLYMFCSEERNPGIEYDMVSNGVQLEANITPTYGIEDLHMIRQWSKRYAFEHEFSLGEIDLNQPVLDEDNNWSNVYPLIGNDVEQNENGVFLKDAGEALLIGGAHQPLAAYILNADGIQPGDYRYIEVFDANQTAKLKVGIDANKDVYNLISGTPVKLGTMNDRSNNIIICTTWRDTLIYNER